MKKFGIKFIFDNEININNKLIKIIHKYFQYCEISLYNISKNAELIDIIKKNASEIIGHVPHENYGIDIGISTKKKYILKIINKNVDLFKDSAKYIILHCGTSNIKNARDILREIRDYNDIILLENMPVVGIHGERCLGYDAESFLSLNKYDFGLCLDFGHAIKASISLKRSYIDLISEFAELNPEIFHVSDGKFDKEIDEHLNIGDGEYDFEFIVDIINKSKGEYVTLETPRNNINSIKNDLRNLHILKNLILKKRT
jgi:endonuclease IV